MHNKEKLRPTIGVPLGVIAAEDIRHYLNRITQLTHNLYLLTNLAIATYNQSGEKHFSDHEHAYTVTRKTVDCTPYLLVNMKG